jgi:hypothetical protein
MDDTSVTFFLASSSFRYVISIGYRKITSKNDLTLAVKRSTHIKVLS